MSNETPWLERLNSATSYRDLQAVFSQMAADVRGGKNAVELAASIDEAIRRIEQERIRDHAAMDATASDYEAFKQEQSGVVGWFRRKLPFTATRRQELQHRESINEVRAEILADNFVIARAQMLKEQLLPAQSRRLGNRPADWRAKLLQQESIHSIREYGNLVGLLGLELQQSKIFLDTVRADIEAFAEALFADQDDRKQRDTDLLAARAEIKALHDETEDKSALRKSTLRRLGQLVNEELTTNDLSYRSTLSRIQHLKNVQEIFVQTAKLLDEYRSILKASQDRLVELESLPKQRDELEIALKRIRQESDQAENRRKAALADFEQPSASYNAALRESQQAKAAADASKRLYDAYLTEQNQGQAEVSSAADFEAASPVVAEYQRLRNLAEEASDKLRLATPLYESAKRRVDQTAEEANAASKKIESLSKELAALSEKEIKTRSEDSKNRESLLRVEPQLKSSLRSLQESLAELDWFEAVKQVQSLCQEAIAWLAPSNSVFPASTIWSASQPKFASVWDSASIQRKAGLGDRIAPAFQAAKKQIEDELARQTTARRDALQHRCQMLLDDHLTKEVLLET